MKREIEDLTARLADGAIDKSEFDEGVALLIDESAQPAEEPPAEPADEGKQSAVRSYEIKKAARRARSL